MPRWVSIPLILGGGWIFMKIIGIEIYPSYQEALSACEQAKIKELQLHSPGLPYCNDSENGQILFGELINFQGGNIIKKRFFYL
jgi:hypothetical protein